MILLMGIMGILTIFVSITIGMTMRGKKVGRFRRRVFVKCNTNE